MNRYWYAGKFDEASWQLLATLGFSPGRFRRDESGMVALEQRIEYKRELHAGDVVTVHSAVVDVRDKCLTLRHELSNDETGDLCATTGIVGLHIDAVARKGRRLPDDLRARAISLMDACLAGESRADAC